MDLFIKIGMLGDIQLYVYRRCSRVFVHHSARFSLCCRIELREVPV